MSKINRELEHFGKKYEEDQKKKREKDIRIQKNIAAISKLFNSVVHYLHKYWIEYVLILHVMLLSLLYFYSRSIGQVFLIQLYSWSCIIDNVAGYV